MTAELSTTVAELVARAKRDVAEHVSETELTLTSGHDRDTVVCAVAVELLAEYGRDWLRLAYLAAEAVAQLVPPVQPLPPAAADIRLAHDYPGFGGEDADRARRHADADLRGGR